MSKYKWNSLLVRRNQARQLVEWAGGGGMDALPEDFMCIVKRGRYAYFSDGFSYVRWDVEGLDVPDGSWIALIPSDPAGEPDTLTNMADWSKVADERERWDLMDEKRWRTKGKLMLWDCEEEFTRARTAAAPVMFDPDRLVGLRLLVTGIEAGEIVMSPTRPDGSGPWWVMGEDYRVAGLCQQSGDTPTSEVYLPEAYREKKGDGEATGEWYADLDLDDMADKHVHVQFDNGIVIEGPLIYDTSGHFVRVGHVRDVPISEGLYSEEETTPPVLYKSDDRRWCPFSDVKAITPVWDEKEWVRIDPSVARKGDALVVNGDLWDISEPVLDDKEETLIGWKVGSRDGFVYRSMVSCALRRKGDVSNE